MENKKKKILIGVCGALVLALAVGLIVFLVTKDHYRKQAEQEPEIAEEETETEPEIIRRDISYYGDILEAGFQRVGELVTAEYYYTEMEEFDSSIMIEDFKIPFTASSYTIQYDGLIKAGVDFTAIEIDLDSSAFSITVKIPQATIISSEIDNDSLQVFNQKESIFNNITVEDMNASLADLKATAESTALRKGLIAKANDNAKTLLDGFIGSWIDTTEVNIVYITMKESEG